jgi:hypothetical protein
VAVVLPVARQLPAAHATHDVEDVNAVPPPDQVPTAHGNCVADDVPAGQKKPGGQTACVAFVDWTTQK